MDKQQRKTRVSAIIVAAGSGSRMNMNMSKQFVKIHGIPVLARTIQAFEECGAVDEIILVVNESDLSYCSKDIVTSYGFRKVRAIVPGGNKRQKSVMNGLLKLDDTAEIVLIHDGARPFIDADCILNCIEAAMEFGAVCAAVRVKDTIKSADERGLVQMTLDRSQLWSVQTPQAFRYDIAMEAHRTAARDGFSGTDDAMLAERLGYNLKIVKGSYYNIKITTQEDLVFAEAIASFKEQSK